MKSKIAAVFMLLAGLGFLISFVAHASSIFGFSVFPKEPWFLHFGIFVVWIPAVLCAQSLAKVFPQKQMWKAALRGCPKPMQYMAYALFGYVFLNFAIFAITNSNHTPTSASTVRGFSGHWLIFYYAAFAILYSYIQVQKQDPARRCQNGHLVNLSAKYCPECGTSVGDALAGES
ncbi:hypothetical protein HNP49_003166 [Pseudomonas fluvialis]|uniref:Uncharacterized protein n=1 Tax=Pseudomonas fluvialis TaxID=1793966 RepID=A0A7X0ET45_9PSED|nr:hypothetical protein [Pseudomonas fluvialis]MBB6342978.1 hypothetical protein [Pseudomonas fluvialis]